MLHYFTVMYLQIKKASTFFLTPFLFHINRDAKKRKKKKSTVLKLSLCIEDLEQMWGIIFPKATWKTGIVVEVHTI